MFHSRTGKQHSSSLRCCEPGLGQVNAHLKRGAALYRSGRVSDFERVIDEFARHWAYRPCSATHVTSMKLIAGANRSPMFALAPETWRADLLNIALRCTAIFGAIVYVPSAVSATNSDDQCFHARHACACLGAGTDLLHADTAETSRDRGLSRVLCPGPGLMLSDGSISQIYRFDFSLLTHCC